MKIIAFISQKGGVGKSTFARALAVEATREGLTSLLVDLDPGQQTSYKWSLRREREPKINAKVFNSFAEVKQEIKRSKYDLVIIDGSAMISAMTYEIVKEADYIIQPVKPYLDDLEPAVIDYNSLVNEGIAKQKLLFVINQVIKS